MQADRLITDLKQKANQTKSEMPLLTEMPTGYALCTLDLETGSFSSEKLKPTFFVIMADFSMVSVVSAMN